MSDAEDKPDNSSDFERVSLHDSGENAPLEKVPDEDSALHDFVARLSVNGPILLREFIRVKIKESNCGTFDEFTKTEKGSLSRKIPPTLLKKLFPDSSKSKDLDSLDFFDLGTILSSEKVFVSDEKMNFLINLTDKIHKLKIIQADGTKEDFSALKNEIINSLAKLIGSTEEDILEQLNKDCLKSKSQNVFQILEDDPFLRAVHLKKSSDYWRDNSKGKDILKDLEKEIKKIQNQDLTLSLDLLEVVRPTLSSYLESGALKCVYCSNSYSQPRTLPCLHSGCLTCLNGGINQSDKAVTCLICGTRVAAADENAIKQLPCTFIVSRLLQLNQGLKDESVKFICMECPHLAQSIDLQSGNFYCDNHSYPIFHTDEAIILNTGSLLSSDKVEDLVQTYCPLHSKVLNKYCAACKVPLCNSPSCITWHSQHGDLKEINEETQSLIKSMHDFNNLLLVKRDVFATKIRSAESNQVDVADMQENVKSSVQKYFKDINEMLKEKEEEFLRELNRAVDTCWNQDEATRHALGKWNEMYDKLLPRFGQISEVRSSPSEESNTKNAENNKSSKPCPITRLSSLKTEMLDLLADTASGCSLLDVKCISYPEGELRGMLHHCNNLICGITTQPRGNGWQVAARMSGLKNFTVSGNILYTSRRTLLSGSGIYTFDLKELGGDFTTYFTQGGMHQFQGLAMDANGSILIPGETLTTLDVSSMKLKYFFQLNIISQQRQKIGSADIHVLNTFNRVIIKTLIEQIDGKRKTRIFIADDQCICEMGEVSPRSYTLLRKFDFYTMLTISDFAPEIHRDLIVVTDATRHCLMIFNCKSHTMINVGSQGATPGNFSYPSGVAIDQFGHIFVADGGNSRIQVIDFSGKFLRLINYPTSLKEVTEQSTAVTNAKVELQINNAYLYVFDTRLEVVWRLKYM